MFGNVFGPDAHCVEFGFVTLLERLHFEGDPCSGRRDAIPGKDEFVPKNRCLDNRRSECDGVAARFAFEVCKISDAEELGLVGGRGTESRNHSAEQNRKAVESRELHQRIVMQTGAITAIQFFRSVANILSGRSNPNLLLPAKIQREGAIVCRNRGS